MRRQHGKRWRRTLIQSFVEAAQWASTVSPELPCTCGDGRDRAADCANCEPDPIPADEFELAAGATVALGLLVCRWQRDNAKATDRAAEMLDCERYDGWEMLGHSAYLDSAGHGTGLWDRGLPDKFGKHLSDSAKAMGCEFSYCLYLDDDGTVSVD